MSGVMMIVLGALGGVLLIALAAYIVTRWYEARSDRTFMTHDEAGFRRALAGRGVIWDIEESIVRGPGAPPIEFVASDPATGGRRMARLLDARTGAINLRPQYCVPRPFSAVTADAHKVIVEARVQFSLNRALLKHVYQIEDFGMALETRIQSAFRAEIGRRRDEELRAALADVEAGVVEHLRRAEREGDEAGELGMALGVVFHTANFTFVEADDAEGAALMAAMSAPAHGAPQAPGAAVASIAERGRAGAHFAQGVLAMNPQHLDRLADKFKGRAPEETQALLALMEMQTRQNIAEALAASGQLMVLTPEELGLFGANAAARQAAKAPPGAPNA